MAPRVTQPGTLGSSLRPNGNDFAHPSGLPTSCRSIWLLRAPFLSEQTDITTRRPWAAGEEVRHSFCDPLSTIPRSDRGFKHPFLTEPPAAHTNPRRVNQEEPRP